MVEPPRANGQTLVRLADGQRVTIQSERRPSPGDKVTFAYRPEQMRLATDNETEAGGSIVNANVVSHSYIGGRWQIGLDVGGNPIRIETQEATAARQLRLWLPLAGGILFPGQSHAPSH